MPASFVSRMGSKALLIWDILDWSALGHYRKLSRPVDGWLTRDEEAVLFRLAAAVPREQCIVELGSWFGRSAILLGGASLKGRGAPVFAVDLFRAAGLAQEVYEARAGEAAKDFLQRFLDNMRGAGLERKVTAIRSSTAELGQKWTGPPVGLLFIDADHSYEGVSQDWAGWVNRFGPAAKVAFHDYENPAYEGVTRFVNERLAAGNLCSVARKDSILWGEVVHGGSVP